MKPAAPMSIESPIKWMISRTGDSQIAQSCISSESLRLPHPLDDSLHVHVVFYSKMNVTGM